MVLGDYDRGGRWKIENCGNEMKKYKIMQGDSRSRKREAKDSWKPHTKEKKGKGRGGGGLKLTKDTA